MLSCRAKSRHLFGTAFEIPYSTVSLVVNNRVMVHPVGLQVGRPDVFLVRLKTKSAAHYVSRWLNINTIDKL